MIIKHIRGSENWDVPCDFVLQANSYTVQEMDDNRILFMAQDGHGTAFEVFKGDDELYIMNDNGRTIDSYVWPKGQLVEVN